MKKRVLGRGLEALIPEAKSADAPETEIDIDRIVRNPSQPRLKLDEARLEELAASIRQNGVLQPILVRPFEDGYQLVAGERRLSAAQRAGLLKIPVTVRNVPDNLLLELALIENIQREPLNPIEEAQAYQKLMETASATQEQIAERLGRDRSTIANSVRLLKLPPLIKLFVADGKLSPGHARALLASNATPSEMAQTAAFIIEKDWSVRETERWAKLYPKAPTLPTIQDPNEAAAADRLRLLLGAKVDIHAKTKEKGEIRIYYYSQEELMRLYAILANKAIPTEPSHAIQEGKRSG
jgi:ParB family transcriptional regulator, chromosome partitioning protein